MRIKIVYSDHLRFRLKLRKIPYGLPETIYRKSKEKYFDKITFNKIALGKIKFKGKIREMAVVYRESADQVVLITTHPLKSFQKTNRIQSNRWQRI